MVDKKAQRILVYRPGQIGDTVVALPAMWAIREHFPSSRICLLTGRHPQSNFVSAVEVLPNEGLFDDCMTYPTSITGVDPKALVRVLPEIRRQRFDTLVYLLPRVRTRWQVRRDVMFFRLAGIGKIIGDVGLNTLVRPIGGGPLPVVENETDDLLERLALGGIAVPPRELRRVDLRLNYEERSHAAYWLSHRVGGRSDSKQLIAIGPGSKRSSRRWPEPQFAELGKILIDELGLFPIIVGGREDRDLGERLISNWRIGANAAGELSVRESAAVLSNCQLYVGNDTGAMHLAAASGISCVVIFSSADWPGQWYPYGNSHTVLRSSVPCEGCRLDDCIEQELICLRQISVPDVLSAIKQTLAHSVSAERAEGRLRPSAVYLG